MKKALYVAGCLLVVLSVTACGNPKLKNGEQVIATIDGKKYTADELYKELKSQYGYEVLMGWVDEKIASEEVKDSKDIDSYADEAISYYSQYAQAYGMTLAQFATSYLGISGITSEDDLRAFIIKDRKLNIAIQNYVANQLSDKEISKYYEENYKTTYNYRVIVLEDEENASTILKELKNTKSDKLESKFSDLAKKYSEDKNTAENGGLVENATKNTVDEKVWNAISKLGDKKYSKDAISTDAGVYIVYRIKKGKSQELKDIKDEVKKTLASDKLTNDQTLQYDALTALRNKYKLSFKDSDLKAAYDAYLKDVIEYKKSITVEKEEK